MSEVKVHLGCGKRFLPGYVHIDRDTHDHIDYNQDIRKLAMFSDESVDVIYNCGTFEYFDRFEAMDVLKEWYRVLKVGGVLRVSVPDFESIIKVYDQNNGDLDGKGILGPLFGRIEIKTPSGYETIYHKTVYDFKSLKNTLLNADFRDIRKYDCRDILPEGYDDYSMAYMPHGDTGVIQVHLNVECIK